MTKTKIKPKTIKPKAKKVTKAKKMVSKKPVKKTVAKKKKRYFEAVGRRKTSVARVRLFATSPLQSVAEDNLIINDKPHKDFFLTPELQQVVEAPLRRLKSLNRFGVTVRVKGGGIRGQAEAIRHGLSRTLILFDPNFRKKLKKAGYLTRDPRKKERKKYGLKKARRAPQWRKR